MLPTGHWQFRHLLATAALCAALASVCAQTDSASEDEGLEPLASHLPEPLSPPEPEPEPEPSSETLEAQQSEPPSEPFPAQPSEPPPAPEELAVAEPAGPNEAASAAIGNVDIETMVAAEFSDSTIIAVIGANAVQFDLTPRALVALKGAGVSEPVIAAMLEAEAAKERVEEPEPTAAELAETQASIEYAKLTEMNEELAAQQEAAVAARRQPEPPASRTDPAPRVWLIHQQDRASIAPTIAQVAFAGGSGRRGERMKNLQGIAGQALAFANPAVSGIATTLGSFFRPDEERTAVWALAGTQSSRVLDMPPVFEMDFAHIPGVDPDRYEPAIVQLVATNDNYRLVAAAETDGANTGALPRGPIIEESIATESTRLGRGQYRVASKMPLGPGEYALVLRPIPETRRSRRRDETSLGELLGGSTSQILYLTWEFSIAAG